MAKVESARTVAIGVIANPWPKEAVFDYAKKLLNVLNYSDIRGLIDERDEKIGKKIRDAEIRKVPYMLVVGEKEQDNQSVSVRRHGKGDIGSFSISEFTELVNTEISQMSELINEI